VVLKGKSSSLDYCSIWIMELLDRWIWKSVDMDMCSLSVMLQGVSLSLLHHIPFSLLAAH
jgi:hypothetical protein